MSTEPAGTEIAAIDSAMARGELFLAYDTAAEGLKRHPCSLLLKHRALLALARTGATERALRLYREWQLDEARPDDSGLAVDLAALGGRLLKDRALAAPATRQPEMLAAAANAYLAAFRLHGGYYPGANAAALFVWAGQVARAREIAEQVRNQPSGHDHYALSSRAECLLILGDAAGAARLISAAAGSGGDQMARTTTRRQLARTCAALGIDPAILAPLRAHGIVRYAGHMAGKRLPRQHEPQLAAAIARTLADVDAATGYGALAAGADILFAEALLARGAELNVVLPFPPEAFRPISVDPFEGGRWIPRFERCLAQAESMVIATNCSLRDDALPFRYATELASGAAVLRGQALDAPVILTAVWDGDAGGAVGGTAEDIRVWSRLGLPQRLLGADGSVEDARPGPQPEDPSAGLGGREIRPVVFGDVSGFGRLLEKQMPAFADEILGVLARAVMPFADHILVRNTWGDGIFLVLDDIQVAAECLLQLRQAFEAVDLAGLALPLDLGLRLGAHYGPMTRTTDPFTGRTTYLGVQVIRAARIEPVTPPGTAYVTEQFAAALALRPDSRLRCEYVGQLTLAKDCGEARIFSLSLALHSEDVASGRFAPPAIAYP